MMRKYYLFICFVAINIKTIVNATDKNVTQYDCLTSKPVSEELLAKYIEAGNENICTKKVAQCDPDDYSRLDGSCYNLDNPAVGTYNTPSYWMVPTVFGENNTQRTTQDGEPLPVERKCRTEIFGTGVAPHDYLTTFFGSFLNTFLGDFVAIHDELNVISTSNNCCKEGKDNDICAPMEVPADDPVHRFSGLRCMNMTKPLTYQTYGCADKDTEPVRIGNFTHPVDLSFLYYVSPTSISEVRTYEGGKLKVEVEDGIIWPPNAETNASCMANVFPEETRCSRPTINQNFGPNLVSILLYRLHNVIATKMSDINPCWSDDKLFYVTRDIMIAIYSQIQFNEMWPLIIGRQNMINAGIISNDKGSRDIYDENILPVVSADFVYAGRWFHTMQSGTVRMFDAEGYYVKEIPITNLTQRTGYIARNGIIAMMTQGAFRDTCSAADDLVDPFIVDSGFGTLQYASDIVASDQVRGRQYGVAPYVKYRDFCNSSQTHTTYEDIAPIIRPNKLKTLKKLFANVSDIDLIVGMNAEKLVPGTEVPYTLLCILMKDLPRMVKSNRHWYESSKRPHAFTAAQLAAIRNATASWILCTVGDGVTQIQPQAFRMPTVGNEIVNCSSIPTLNFTVWADDTCNTTTTNYTNSTSTTTESSATTIESYNTNTTSYDATKDNNVTIIESYDTTTDNNCTTIESYDTTMDDNATTIESYDTTTDDNATTTDW